VHVRTSSSGGEPPLVFAIGVETTTSKGFEEGLRRGAVGLSALRFFIRKDVVPKIFLIIAGGFLADGGL